MKSFLTKLIVITLLCSCMISFSACSFWDNVGGYITGDGIGDYPYDEEGKKVNISQGTAVTQTGGLAEVIDGIMPAVVSVYGYAQYSTRNFFSQIITDETGFIGIGVVIKQDDTHLYFLTGSAAAPAIGDTIVSDGRVWTCTDVEIIVILNNGLEFSAERVEYIENLDSAIVRVNKEELSSHVDELQVCKLPDVYRVKDGDRVIAISNPLGVAGGSVTAGYVSSEREMSINGTDVITLLQTDAAFSLSSGGVLFNVEGELLGVFYGKSVGTGIERLSFAVPIDDIINGYHEIDELTEIVIGE